MYSLFAPLEETMRTLKGHELFDINVTMERKTSYTFLNEIVSQITSSRSLSEKMTLSVKKDDECTNVVKCVYHPSSYIERGQVINDLMAKGKGELYQTTVDEIRRGLEIPHLVMSVFIEDTSSPNSVVVSADKFFSEKQKTLTSQKLTENVETPVNITEETAKKAPPKSLHTMATERASLYKGSNLVHDYICSTCEDIGLDVKAKYFCKECEYYMCDKCVRLHNGVNRKHTVYGRGNIQKWVCSTLDNLDKHGIKLKLKCNDHQELCCYVCAAMYHT
ncbi:uncharacterized protein LOC128233391 isoform X1 [Mya arenaria]|uniref:uncharacterized protein LOC128233391 isoform X1 n=1 Tax=Mya arenaria TaxID=6604 RepID=UPI0022E1A5FA|nr:uncharacterized protein LOC128233391 isoform X1 [Mya arenaria]XP_052803008.1 uncharacterized protein LOC128233391 isoform X1 [Mya arenaria]